MKYAELPRPRSGPANLFYRRLPGRLAVVTCYFNPCGYWSLKRNYQRFAGQLQSAQVPLYTIELAFADEPFFLGRGDRVAQIRGADVLWQKERLLNLLIERLPPQFDKVAWIDADLYFDNPHWHVETAERLETCPIVQLFERVDQLDKTGQSGETVDGLAYAVARKLGHARHLGISHPGFAWAARRELLARHGLVDNHVLGGGDSLMVLAMFGWWDHPYLARVNDGLRDDWRRWAEPFWRAVQGHVGYVPGLVRHMWHGSRADRRYRERMEHLRRGDFDPVRDIRRASNGTWQWSSDKPHMHRTVRQYFYDRREDA